MTTLALVRPAAPATTIGGVTVSPSPTGWRCRVQTLGGAGVTWTGVQVRPTMNDALAVVEEWAEERQLRVVWDTVRPDLLVSVGFLCVAERDDD